MAAGVLLAATTCGVFAKFGLHLIIEAVSDCFATVKGIMSASWDWVAWGLSIAISIATSIACFAFSALSKPGSFKALKNAIKHPLKMAKAGLNAAKNPSYTTTVSDTIYHRMGLP